MEEKHEEKLLPSQDFVVDLFLDLAKNGWIYKVENGIETDVIFDDKYYNKYYDMKLSVNSIILAEKIIKNVIIKHTKYCDLNTLDLEYFKLDVISEYELYEENIKKCLFI